MTRPYPARPVGEAWFLEEAVLVGCFVLVTMLFWRPRSASSPPAQALPGAQHPQTDQTPSFSRAADARLPIRYTRSRYARRSVVNLLQLLW